MSKRYAIWDKQSPVITPSGEIFTAEQWINKFPVAGLDSVTVLCAPGEINGGLFATLGQVKTMYENQGVDFSECTTDEEILDLIDAFEDERAAAAAEAAMQPTAEDRQAAALEAIADGQTTENAAALDTLLTGEE